MPLDGLSLGFLVREMQTLVGGRVDRVSQPEKDMVVLVIRADSRNERLLISASPALTRFHLTAQTFVNPPDAPMFCMLLRKYLLGGRIMEISQVGGDRLIRIVIDNRDELGVSGARELWFEAMGRHSNLTLVMNGQIVDAIRHVTYDMSRVRQALPGLPFTLPPSQGKLPPQDVTSSALENLLSSLPQDTPLPKALQGAIAGLSPVSAREFTLRVSGMTAPRLSQAEIPSVCQKTEALCRNLSSMAQPTLLTQDGMRTDFFPFPYFTYPAEEQSPCATLSEALDRFYSGRDRIDRMEQKSAALKRTLKTLLERDEKKLALQEEELDEASRADEYRLRGEMLSAQLHLVKKGMKTVTLPNYYDEAGGTIDIPLDETLSPVQNAQKYFKRYRKLCAARHTAREQKEKTLSEMALLQEALLDIGNCETPDDLQDIRRVLTDEGILKPERGKNRVKKPPLSKPYEFVSSDGFVILVGKNSIQNERLTRQARGDDLWLHAKNMPGSHVIVQLNGQEPPQRTILDAAMLAAFYSSGRGVSVPVDYTFRRCVKKPAGTPVGFVTFTNNKTLLISATEQQVNALKKARE